MKTLQPTNGNLLLEKVEDEKKDTGILIPESVDKKYLFAKVIARPSSLEDPVANYPGVGSTVLVPRHLGTHLKFEGKDYIIVGATCVLAVVVEE